MTTETKELIIEAHIPLPEDYFEEAEIAAKMKEVTDLFRASLADALGDGNFRVFTTRALPKPPRAPRKQRSDAGQPRGPRRRAAPNGSAEQPTA